MSSQAEPGTFRRLPETARPNAYHIAIRTDLEAFTFSGESEIEVEVLKETSELVLNASHLKVDKASVQVGQEEIAGEPLVVQAAEELQVKLPAPLKPGPAKLRLRFSGDLSKKLHGLYRSSYTLNGQEKWMATTQFESTYARQAFPCWDEPCYKAIFHMALTVPKALTALSNMPASKEEEAEGGAWKKIYFQPSPKMSSYLVAMVVSELDHVAAKTKEGVDVRVYTLPGKAEQGRFALECGVKALEYFSDFFGVPYPLPKSDLIAIPDFAMGAMENWGLVTYREVYLLVEEGKSSVQAKQHITLIVGHELAHMWFGNLATMKWWTDLWLKEGFATYCEYMFVAHAYPEFDIWMVFANAEIGRAFDLDALKSSHPIEVPIENPNELEEIYDGISYAKSASIIGMLRHHIGYEAFQKGAAAYLKRYQFANAETADLWREFSEASGQDVAALMSGWTKRMGYPLLSVTSSFADGKHKLKLSQRRFIADGSEDPEATVWTIPVSVTAKSSPDVPVHKFLLSTKEAEVAVAGPAESEWLKLNAALTGFYRVQYSPEMLKPLLEAMKEKKLGPLDRFNLVTDQWALVHANLAPAVDFLRLVQAAGPTEDNYNVWAEIDTGIGSIKNALLRHPKTLDAFQAFVRKAYRPAYERLGWEAKPGEDVPSAKLRSLLIARLGFADDAELVAKCNAAVESGVGMSADLRSSILRVYGQKGGAKAQAKLKELYTAAAMSEEQRQCLAALPCAPDKALAKAALDFGKEKVRPADYYLLFAYAATTAPGQDTAWEYLGEHWSFLLEHFGGANSSLFQALCKFVSRGFASEEKAKEIAAFFAAKDLPVLKRPIDQSLEAVRLNADLIKNNLDSLAKFLN